LGGCRFAKQNATFHYLPEPLAAVRYYAGTKTLSGTRERFREIYRVEKKYGHRMFRRSVVGAYYHGLSYKKNRTPWESLFYRLFDLLRKTKQKIHPQSLLYGFQRWDPIFVKKCRIHLPWYDEKKDWGELRLQIKSNGCRYRIHLNQIELDPVYHTNGEITATLPLIENPHRVFQIECESHRKCKLMNFSIDLKDRNTDISL